MLNQNQTQNQSSFQQYQQDQPHNPFPKSQRKDSNSNIPMNFKYSSNKPYQPRNNSSNRERSRSREISPRQSYHNYPQGNSDQNNNYNNRNNKPYHYRQNNDKQFDINMNKRENNFSWGYNNNGYNPSRDDCLIIFQKNYSSINLYSNKLSKHNSHFICFIANFLYFSGNIIFNCVSIFFSLWLFLSPF